MADEPTGTDTAVADPPAEQQPHGDPLELHPGLQALVKRTLPIDGETAEAESEPENRTDRPDGTNKPEPEKPAKPGADPDKTELRLAPEPKNPEDGDQKPEVSEEPEFPEELITNAKSEKAKGDLRSFRERHNALVREVNQLREAAKTAKPAAAEPDPGLAAENEQLRAQNTELSSLVERVKLEMHPEFKRQFVEPVNRMMSDAATILKENNGDPKALEKALGLTGRAKVDALDDLVASVDSPVLRGRLERLLDTIDDLGKRGDAILQDAKGNREKLLRDEKIAQHQQIEQQEKQLRSLLGSARQTLSEELKLEVLQKDGRPEYKWWDDQVDDIARSAEEILLKGTPERIAVAAWLGASAGAYRSLYHAERKARQAAEARNRTADELEPDLKDRKPVTERNGEFAPDADITQVALERLRRGDFNGSPR